MKPRASSTVDRWHVQRCPRNTSIRSSLAPEDQQTGQPTSADCPLVHKEGHSGRRANLLDSLQLVRVSYFCEKRLCRLYMAGTDARTVCLFSCYFVGSVPCTRAPGLCQTRWPVEVQLLSCEHVKRGVPVCVSYNTLGGFFAPTSSVCSFVVRRSTTSPYWRPPCDFIETVSPTLMGSPSLSSILESDAGMVVAEVSMRDKAERVFLLQWTIYPERLLDSISPPNCTS